MIQEYDVGMPLQIVRDNNTEVIDLKIVDRTFSKLLTSDFFYISD